MAKKLAFNEVLGQRRAVDGHERAVATSAVRDSRNGPELVDRVRRETGIRLETITGTEEARQEVELEVAEDLLVGQRRCRRRVERMAGAGFKETARDRGTRRAEGRCLRRRWRSAAARRPSPTHRPLWG